VREEVEVYQRTTQISMGKGSSSELVARINTDLAPMTLKAEGFLAYYAVQADDVTVITTRIFEDLASLDAETKASQAVMDTVAEDFDFTDLVSLVDGEVALGIAYGLRSEFRL
jgi:hypothetical protein